MKDKTKLKNVKREKGKLKEKNNKKTENNIAKNSTKSLSKKICILIIIFLILVIAFAISSIYIGKDKQKLSKVKLANINGPLESNTETTNQIRTSLLPEMSDTMEFESESGDAKIKLKAIINSRTGVSTDVTFYLSSDYCISCVKIDGISAPYYNKNEYKNDNVNYTTIEEDRENNTSWMNMEFTARGLNYNNDINATVYMASGEPIVVKIPKGTLSVYNSAPPKPVITANPSTETIMDYQSIKITAQSTDNEGDVLKYIWEEKTSDNSEWQKGTSETSTYNGTSKYSVGKHTIRAKAIDPLGDESDWSDEYSFIVRKSETIDLFKEVADINNLGEYGISIDASGKRQAWYYELYKLGMGSGDGNNWNTYILTINYQTLISKIRKS